MAYVPTFSRIDDEMARQRAAGGEASASGGEAVGGTGGGGVGAAAPSYTQSNYASGKKILEANKNEKLGLDVTQPFREQLGQDIQKENEGFTNYQTQTAAERAKGQVNDADINAYVSGGDEAAKNKIKESLSAAFKPTQYSPYSSSVSMGDVGRLGTSAGLQGAIQQAQEKRGNYGYGQGMSAFDSLLYSRRPETAQQIQGLGNDVAGLRAKQQEHTEQFQKDQNELPSAIKAQQDAARARIQAMADQTLKDDAATGFRSDLSNKAQASARASMLGTIQNHLRAGAAGIDDPVAKEEYLNSIKGLSADDINTLVSASPTASNLYSEAAANRFNRLSDLIDGKDRVKAGTIADASTTPTIDKQNFDKKQKDLRGAASSAANIKKSAAQKQKLEYAAQQDRAQAYKNLERYGFKDEKDAQAAIDKVAKAGQGAGMTLPASAFNNAKLAQQYLNAKKITDAELDNRFAQRFQES